MKTANELAKREALDWLVKKMKISSQDGGTELNDDEIFIQSELWDEDRTSVQPLLYLDASTYRVDKLFDSPPVTPSRFGEDFLVSPRSRYAYQNRIVPEGVALPLEGPQNGFVTWSDDVVIPTLIDTTRACGTGERFPREMQMRDRMPTANVWMSLTPSEMISQRRGIELAAGIVLVGGLGLGWFLRKVCEKEAVEKVILVEKSKELLDWYGYDVAARYSKVIEVICDDVYNQIGKHGRVICLLDIWPTYQCARHDSRYRAAKRKLKKRLWAWGT